MSLLREPLEECFPRVLYFRLVLPQRARTREESSDEDDDEDTMFDDMVEFLHENMSMEELSAMHRRVDHLLVHKLPCRLPVPHCGASWGGDCRHETYGNQRVIRTCAGCGFQFCGACFDGRCPR